jgi:hypothetical protein
MTNDPDNADELGILARKIKEAVLLENKEQAEAAREELMEFLEFLEESR